MFNKNIVKVKGVQYCARLPENKSQVRQTLRKTGGQWQI